jgi:sec-independent protein translocase protein TatA
MGELQPIHWIVVLIIVLMIFGAGKLPNVMADLGKGIRSFRGEVRSGADQPSSTPPSPDRPKQG